jgi:hypothetical protein
LIIDLGSRNRALIAAIAFALLALGFAAGAAVGVWVKG